jgi:hypothetical protein
MFLLVLYRKILYDIRTKKRKGMTDKWELDLWQN